MLIVANVLVAAGLVYLYWKLKRSYGWFGKDHLKIPEWMSLISIPLGIVVPTSQLAIDGMLIVGLVFFVNEGLYQSLGISPLGRLIHEVDKRVLRARKG